MTSDPAPPSLPSAELEAGGWVETEVSVETVFSLPMVRVRGATIRYEDDRTARALSGTLDGDIEFSLRFFAGTRLAFDPPLPGRVTPVMVAPMLRSQARTTFERRLRERGLVDVERDGAQQMRLCGRPATVTKFSATVPVPTCDGALPLACWVAVWTDSEGATIVTSGHPTVELATQFDLDTDDDSLTRSGQSYREEFFSLLRAVE